MGNVYIGGFLAAVALLESLRLVFSYGSPSFVGMSIAVCCAWVSGWLIAKSDASGGGPRFVDILTGRRMDGEQ